MHGFVEGRLEIFATEEGYVATFTPYDVGNRGPSGQMLRLSSRSAVAEFLQDIGTRTARIIRAVDDLRERRSATLPSVFLTETQRERFRS
jgi:hypothetical protein